MPFLIHKMYYYLNRIAIFAPDEQKKLQSTDKSSQIVNVQEDIWLKCHSGWAR